jgi:hypothetical protein
MRRESGHTTGPSRSVEIPPMEFRHPCHAPIEWPGSDTVSARGTPLAAPGIPVAGGNRLLRANRLRRDTPRAQCTPLAAPGIPVAAQGIPVAGANRLPRVNYGGGGTPLSGVADR